MLIKCPECNHDNQLGAIFCRNCGGKLDIEKMEPKVKDKASFNFIGLLRKLILLLLVFVLVGLVCGVFLPMGYKEYAPLPEDMQKEVIKKMDDLFKRCQQGYGRNNSYAFTQAEATYGFNSMFLQKIEGDQGSSYYIDEMIIDLNQNRNLDLILKTRLAGKVPVRFTLTGMPVTNYDVEEGGLSFNVYSAKIGHLPAPSAIQSKVLEKFLPLLDGQSVNTVLAALDSIEIDEQGNIVLQLKKPKPQKKAGKKGK